MSYKVQTILKPLCNERHTRATFCSESHMWPSHELGVWLVGWVGGIMVTSPLHNMSQVLRRPRGRSAHSTMRTCRFDLCGVFGDCVLNVNRSCEVLTRFACLMICSPAGECGGAHSSVRQLNISMEQFFYDHQPPCHTYVQYVSVWVGSPLWVLSSGKTICAFVGRPCTVCRAGAG
jgi:hypothetical protein